MTTEITTTTPDNFTNYLVERLNTEDEKHFALHFKLYLEHGYNTTTFPIDFDDVWKMCEFTRKNDAKKILLKHFEENKDYIIKSCSSEIPSDLSKPEQSCYAKLRSDISTPEHVEDKRINNGGHNKETIMLNVDTFKEFCMKASTSKAKEIRSYYIKLEKIFFSYTKDQLYYSNDKIKQLETAVNNFDVKLNQNFKNAFKLQNVVYIMKLQSFEDGTYIIKIGKTDNINDRANKLSSQYCTPTNPLIIMNVYPCEDNNNFEKFLHKHHKIYIYKYTELINNKSCSTETYHINDNKYEKIKRVIDNNIINYNGKNVEIMKENNRAVELQLKLKELETKEKELEFKEKELEFNKKLRETPELFDKYIELYKLKQNITKNDNIIIKNNEENVDDDDNRNIIIENPTNIIKKPEIKDCGPLVQVYDGKDTTKLLHIYNGITDATRNIEGTSFTGIKNAANKKEIYKGYRFHLVNRNDPTSKDVKDIGNSITPRQKLEGKIAMLNETMTNVENVFIKQKDAAEYIEQTVSAMSRAINYKTKLSNKYFMFWDMLDDNIKNNYLENNTLPEITDKQKGKKIHKINPDTNEVVKVYLSISDLIKELKISPKTIKSHSANDTIYNGHKWKII